MSAVAEATQLDPALVKNVLSEYDFTLHAAADARRRPRLALGTWAKANDKIDANATLPDYANFLDDQFVK